MVKHALKALRIISGILIFQMTVFNVKSIRAIPLCSLSAIATMRAITPEQIDGTNTSLYKILEIMEERTKNQLRKYEKDSNDGRSTVDVIQTLVARLVLIEKAKVLIPLLVKELQNNPHTFSSNIDYRFKKICDYFKKFRVENVMELDPTIAPYHIRECKDLIRQFNEHVVGYSIGHKDVLLSNDIELFNKISTLNQILLYSLLTNDCFEIKNTAKVIDWTVYRPAEAIWNHPLTTGVIVAAIFLALVYTLATKNEQKLTGCSKE